MSATSGYNKRMIMLEKTPVYRHTHKLPPKFSRMPPKPIGGGKTDLEKWIKKLQIAFEEYLEAHPNNMNAHGDVRRYEAERASARNHAKKSKSAATILQAGARGMRNRKRSSARSRSRAI